jgi:hypothetical protein
MRRLLSIAVVVLAASSCRDAGTPSSSEVADPLVVTPLPDPYSQVTAGPVQVLVPDRWDSAWLGGPSHPHEGLVASPRLDDWRRMDGSVQGVAAVWLDVARGGIPSDYYYLAASGPVLENLTDRAGCESTYHRVVVDHEPGFFPGPRDRVGSSPGDYVARGAGTCPGQGGLTRWAYFVAAPGLGPVRQVGIPNSGLYVVVAVVRDSPDADRQLRNMLLAAQFGDASVQDLLAAARRSAGQI